MFFYRKNDKKTCKELQSTAIKKDTVYNNKRSIVYLKKKKTVYNNKRSIVYLNKKQTVYKNKRSTVYLNK